jgi:thymidylate synthase (FAD)
MNLERKVLDHGFVVLRNLAGPTRRMFLDEDEGVPRECWNARPFDADDRDPSQAARMSFGQMDSTRTESQDMKLADYLMKNKHTSPFEQVQVWFEMKLPIFVARQFVRHRTTRLNEVSGRYITLPSDWYIPEVLGAKADDKKQGQTDTLSPEKQAKYRRKMHDHAAAGFELYMEMIDDGVAPEHARIVLGLGHYTHWLWNQDLHNMMHFLSLRDHSHAQIEAQQYAKAMDDLLRQHLPETMKIYDKYRRMS